MNQKSRAPIKLRQASNDASSAPMLTTVTFQKTISQPLTLAHLITLAMGILLGVVIMACVHPYASTTGTAPVNTPLSAEQPISATRTDIMLPATTLDVVTSPKTARQDASQSETAEPPASDITSEGAYALLLSERYDEATDALHQLLRNDPMREPERGYLIESLGHSVSLQAEKELNNLLKDTPNDARILKALGRFAMNENNYEAAILHYKSATAIEPEKAETWLALGIAADHADEVDTALDAYHHAARLYKAAPTSDSATINKLQERISYLQQEIEKSP